MKSLVSYITEARKLRKHKDRHCNLKLKDNPQDEIKRWWKSLFGSAPTQRFLDDLKEWNDDVTFEDVYNKIRANGPSDPEKGLWDLIWKTGDKYDNIPYARQTIYIELARKYNIHGGNIQHNGNWNAGVDYDSFLKKWIHEN